MKPFRAAVVLSLVLFVASCGGGSSSTSTELPSVPDGLTTSSQLAQICAPENPFVGNASKPTRIGTLAYEKAWVKAYMDERYLWYKEIPSLNPQDPKYNATSGGVLNVGLSLYNYFHDLLTPRKTVSGRNVDRFSFVTTTEDWSSFAEGAELGYGYYLTISESMNVPIIEVAYVYPNSVAEKAGLVRGDQIVGVDGYSVGTTSAQGAATIQNGLFPVRVGTHTFEISRNGHRVFKTMTAAVADLQQAEHKIVAAGDKQVGYLLFNSHVPSAEKYVVQAFTEFKQKGVTELVVDLRYNGGGYLGVAGALAGAVAGKEKAQGKVFEEVRFSDKRSAGNGAVEFIFEGLTGLEFPTLNLSKIYVLTTDATCSASESFVNGLRGIDVTVELIGSTTCGKPYGFYPQDNCGLTYAAMELEGVNAKGEGRYDDGMAPLCQVNDSLSWKLGDPEERMLSAALKRIQGKTCEEATAYPGLGRLPYTSKARLLKPEWQSNKVLHRKP